MSERPTICVECKHVEPLARFFGAQRLCSIPEEEPDFVEGGMKKKKPLCALKNINGKCVGYEPKEA